VSATRFAKQTGLKYSTPAVWLQRYRRTKPQGRARQVRLLEAAVEQVPEPAAQNQEVLVLQLAGVAPRGSGMWSRRRWRLRWFGNSPSHAEFFGQLKGVHQPKGHQMRQPQHLDGDLSSRFVVQRQVCATET
jgi:hypothetical protein